MKQIIPILPCSDASTLIEFYNHLGFELVGKFIRSYLVLKYQNLELHFYGTKKMLSNENPSMCIIRTENVDELYDSFITGLKSNTGKIPRSGFPKITKIRDLKDDRRFTLTDPSGNTIFVLTEKTTENDTFLRDLENKQYAEKFEVLYDLIYSKEDFKVANNMLQKLLIIKEQLSDLDKGKLLLASLDIQIGLGILSDDTELRSLLTKNQSDEKWKLIEKKLIDIYKKD